MTRTTTLTNYHAADRIDECIERIYLRNFSTFENVRRERPSSCKANLPQGSTDQQIQEEG